MMLIAFRFVEPEIDHRLATQSMLKTIRQCVGALVNPVLGWLFAVMILMYCLEHITFEFYQPYIRLMGFDWFAGDNASLVSAVVISASMFGGTLGAAYSVRLYDRFGIKALLVMAFIFQLAILSGLSLILSGMMLSLVVFRNFPMAMISAPVNATIAPLVDSHLRATYLSIQSLSARLVLSGLLFVLSRTIDLNQALDWNSLSFVLREALLFGVVCTVLVVIMAPAHVSKSKQKSRQKL
jgi:MFS family permease